jgi:hypothetical protein
LWVRDTLFPVDLAIVGVTPLGRFPFGFAALSMAMTFSWRYGDESLTYGVFH